jgi:SanA protein
MMRVLRGLLLLGGSGLIAGMALIFGAHWWIERTAGRYVIGQFNRLPHNQMGLVLGTSAFSKGHTHNPHFDNRMAAAAKLYRTGLVRHLILSGDNGTRGYDEPAQMQRALLAQGVPLAALTRDNAGFRTLDSVVRAKKVFGLHEATIITDRFHCYRAVFLARHFGLQAVAYPAAEVSVERSWKSRLREWLADVKACLDVYVLGTQPRALGRPMVGERAGGLSYSGGRVTNDE